jgi:hypothetical protein
MVALSVAILLGGCAESEPPSESLQGETAKPAPPVTEINPLPAVAPAAAQANPLGGKLAEEVERFDPAVDGWRSESFYDAAQVQLNALAHELEASPDGLNASPVGGYFSTAIHFPSLRPETSMLRIIYQDANIAVRSEPEGWVPAGDYDPTQVLSGFMEPLAGLSAVRIKFKTYRVALASDDATATARVLVTTLGSSDDDKHSVEQHAVWELGWDIPVPDASKSDPVPRIRSISPISYQESATLGGRGSFFSDCTASAFADCPSYETLLLPGLDDWAARTHNQLGMESEGYQGMALGDANGDGLDDLYLCQPGGLPNQLFLRHPDGTLREAPGGNGTDWLERSRSALFIDLDNDRDQDLVVLCNTQVLLMENDGSGAFSQHDRLQLPGSPFSCSAADYDSDGDLDLYVCDYGNLWGGFGDLDERFPIPYHDANNGGANALYRNDGSWRFTNVTKEVGLDQNNRRWSLSCAWEDFDNDGDIDLYVANDFGRNNLYRNDNGPKPGSRTFTDIAPQAGVEDISPGMSVTWGDVNRDGWMDLYVSNMFSGAGNRITFQDQFMPGADTATKGHYQRFARGNALFLNQGDGTFRDGSEEGGVTVGRWAWASRLADFNNDGLEDIAVANGFLTQEDTGDL